MPVLASYCRTANKCKGKQRRCGHPWPRFHPSPDGPHYTVLTGCLPPFLQLLLAKSGAGQFIPNAATSRLFGSCNVPARTEYCFDLVNFMVSISHTHTYTHTQRQTPCCCSNCRSLQLPLCCAACLPGPAATTASCPCAAVVVRSSADLSQACIRSHAPTLSHTYTHTPWPHTTHTHLQTWSHTQFYGPSHAVSRHDFERVGATWPATVATRNLVHW